jgi:hypothetical protein
MTFNEQEFGAGPTEIITFLRAQIEIVRAEKALLEKRYADLEASRETWQKLAAAWEWLAENRD